MLLSDDLINLNSSVVMLSVLLLLQQSITIKGFNPYKSAAASFARNNILVAQYRNLNILNQSMAFEWFNAVFTGMKGSPCELTTQSCCQHHPTNCASLLLLSKTSVAFATQHHLREPTNPTIMLFPICLTGGWSQTKTIQKACQVPT